MATTNDDRCDAIRGNPLDRQIDRSRRQPNAGQRSSIPGDCRPAIRNHRRFAVRQHPAIFQLGKVRRGQLQPVRSVPEQVRFDQTRRDNRWLIAIAARRRKQRRCIRDQVRCPITNVCIDHRIASPSYGIAMLFTFMSPLSALTRISARPSSSLSSCCTPFHSATVSYFTPAVSPFGREVIDSAVPN